MSNINVIKSLYENQDSLERLTAYIYGISINDLNKHYTYTNGIGVNLLNPMLTINSFRFVKRQYQKMDGRQLHHMVITVYKKEYQPTRSHKKNNTKYIWLDLLSNDVLNYIYEQGFQNFYNIHCNTNVFHVHFVINSINYKNGYRIPDLQSFYKGIQLYLKNEFHHLRWEGINYNAELYDFI